MLEQVVTVQMAETPKTGVITHERSCWEVKTRKVTDLKIDGLWFYPWTCMPVSVVFCCSFFNGEKTSVLKIKNSEFFCFKCWL